MTTIKIVIFHSGRVQRLRECLKRVAPLARLPGVAICVSDNSGTGSSRDVVAEYPGITGIVRANCRFPVHFNINRQEATAEVSIFLHDDDWLHESYISVIVAAFADPKVVAVSTNADIVGLKAEAEGKRFTSLIDDMRVRTADELFMAYFGSRPTACPFSLYAYRSSSLKSLAYSDEAAGKYSDVYFLAQLLKQGEIHWCADAHGVVGNFGDNDSHSELPVDRLRQFHALDAYILMPGTLRTARRHIAKKLLLKAVADLYHRRRHAVRWSKYWSIAVRCL